ncbi:PROBABLE ANTIBIOTIC-RESISTANCE PROTEIN [Actinomycetales bacterium JB111]|nr:PROBABLE ANTIBIOTIC-RESISTANCE PROTEIN [Actinomycetales bacterium JB111]
MSVRYSCAVDAAAVTAIDVHVHIEKDHSGHMSLPTEVLEAAATYFRAPTEREVVEQTAAHYREWNMAAVVFTVDATTQLGHAPNSVDDLVAGAADNADVLIPFGSVDPRRADALDELHRQIDLGVRGFKFHPTLQGFDPSNEAYFPVFRAIEEARLVALVHTGQTGIGAHMPGGFGLRLRYSNPMLLDDVAAAHPDLALIMAHPSVPWQDEAISVATHKGNAYIDLSGWSPKYFPEQLVRQAGRLLQDKVLFGSDFPLLSPDRWVTDAAALDWSDPVREKIMRGNAARLLGLIGEGEGAGDA